MPKASKSTYTIGEAAGILEVSQIRVLELVQEGKLSMWHDKGQKYFLGGQLDFCKLMIQPKLPMLPKEVLANFADEG